MDPSGVFHFAGQVGDPTNTRAIEIWGDDPTYLLMGDEPNYLRLGCAGTISSTPKSMNWPPVVW